MKFSGFITFMAVSIVLAAPKADCRNFMEDVYRFEDDGLRFTNSESKEEKRYEKLSSPKKGIDVSKWQGYIDWNEVKKEKIEFAIIRDGFGRQCSERDQTDPKFLHNAESALKAGIPFGVYHYSYAVDAQGAQEEAEFCLRNINEAKSRIKDFRLEYPVAFDVEEERIKGLGPDVLSGICEAFCDRVRREGYFVSIYTCKNWVENSLDKKRLFSKYDLWLAHWTEVPSPSIPCGIWQHSSTGKLKGITENVVDLDLAYYDYPSIVRDAHLNGF